MLDRFQASRWNDKLTLWYHRGKMPIARSTHAPVGGTTQHSEQLFRIVGWSGGRDGGGRRSRGLHLVHVAVQGGEMEVCGYVSRLPLDDLVQYLECCLALALMNQGISQHGQIIDRVERVETHGMAD